MKNTVIVSVSAKDLDCVELAINLSKIGINCDISRNITVLDGSVENGCRVTTTATKDETISKIWKTAQSCGDIKCGHVSVAGGFVGCVNDYPWNSRCPRN